MSIDSATRLVILAATLTIGLGGCGGNVDGAPSAAATPSSCTTWIAGVGRERAPTPRQAIREAMSGSGTIDVVKRTRNTVEAVVGYSDGHAREEFRAVRLARGWVVDKAIHCPL